MGRIIFLCLTLSVNFLTAQDVIYMKNGDRFDVTVLNSGMTSITYKFYNSNDTTVYSASKENLKRIKYANGNSELFFTSKSGFRESNKIRNTSRNNFIKVNPLSPLFGHTQISLEHQINKNSSIEFSFSVIGAGINSSSPILYRYTGNFNEFNLGKKNQSGLNMAVGYKLYVRNQANKLSKANPISSGFYLRPTAYVGRLSFNSYEVFPTNVILRRSNNASFGAFILEPGFQLAVTKNFSIDFYTGLGYIFDNVDFEKSAFLDDGFGYGGGAFDIGYSYVYSVLRLTEKSPGLAMTGGVKLGWTLNKKSPSKKK